MSSGADTRLCTASPASRVYRVAYRDDAWRWVPWEFARFTGRWDDARERFRVLYAGSTRLACFLEVLAQFRPDLELVAQMAAIEGDPDDDFHPTMPAGNIDRSWLDRRCVGSAELTGSYVDVGAAESVAWLRQHLAELAVRAGLPDFDGAALRSIAPRAFTQEISTALYETAIRGEVPDGIRFESRHGNDVELWAMFERPSRGDVEHCDLLVDIGSQVIADADPDLLEALRIHGLLMALYVVEL